MDYEGKLNRIASALSEGRASTMIGAGFSLNSVEAVANPRPMLNWDDLTKELKKQVSTNTDDPLRVAQIVEDVHGITTLEKLVETAVPDVDWKPGPLHSLLVSIPWRDIFTTNWDTFLERAAQSHPRKYSIVLREERIPGARSPRIVKLHGSIQSPPYILTEEHFRKYPHEHRIFVNTVRQSLIENVFCLFGFSATDPNFLAWKGWITDFVAERANKVFLFDFFEDSHHMEYLEARNIVPMDLRHWGEKYEDSLSTVLQTLLASESTQERVDDSHALGTAKNEIFRASDNQRPEASRSVAQIRHQYKGWLVPPEEWRHFLFVRVLQSKPDEVALQDLDWISRLTGKIWISPDELKAQEIKPSPEYLLSLGALDPNLRAGFELPFLSARRHILFGEYDEAQAILEAQNPNSFDPIERVQWSSIALDLGAFEIADKIFETGSLSESPDVREDSCFAWLGVLRRLSERVRMKEETAGEDARIAGARSGADPYVLMEKQTARLRPSTPTETKGTRWSHRPNGPQRQARFGDFRRELDIPAYLGLVPIPLSLRVGWFGSEIRYFCPAVAKERRFLRILHRSAEPERLAEWATPWHLATIDVNLLEDVFAVGLKRINYYLKVAESDIRSPLLNRVHDELHVAAAFCRVLTETEALKLAELCIRIGENQTSPSLLLAASESLSLTLVGRTPDFLRSVAIGACFWQVDQQSPLFSIRGEIEGLTRDEIVRVETRFRELMESNSSDARKTAAVIFALFPQLRETVSLPLECVEELIHNQFFLPKFFRHSDLEPNVVWLKRAERISVEDQNPDQLKSTDVHELLQLLSWTPDVGDVPEKTLEAILVSITTMAWKLLRFDAKLLIYTDMHLWARFVLAVGESFPDLEEKCDRVLELVLEAQPESSIYAPEKASARLEEVIETWLRQRGAGILPSFFWSQIGSVSQKHQDVLIQELVERLGSTDSAEIFDALKAFKEIESQVLEEILGRNSTLTIGFQNKLIAVEVRTRPVFDQVWSGKTAYDGQSQIRFLTFQLCENLATLPSMAETAQTCLQEILSTNRPPEFLSR